MVVQAVVRFARTDGSPDRLVDAGPALIHGFEVEPGPIRLVATDAEDHHATHEVPNAVAPGAVHLPLRPDGVLARDQSAHLRLEVRHRGEDLLPVSPNLGPAFEAPCRMGGGFIAVVEGEAGTERLEVVGIHGVPNAFDQRARCEFPCQSEPSLLGRFHNLVH